MSDAALVSIVGIAGTVTLGIIALVFGRGLVLGLGDKVAMKVEPREAPGTAGLPGEASTPSAETPAQKAGAGS
jgi:hypothetical protein